MDYLILHFSHHTLYQSSTHISPWALDLQADIGVLGQPFHPCEPRYINKQSKIYLKHRTRFYRMMPDVEFKCPMNGTLVILGDDNNEITMS